MKIKPFIFGISGSYLKEEEITLFKKNPVSGFILFRRNIESTDQLKSLIRTLIELYEDRDIPIFLDQEGGRVARLKPPVAQKLYQSAEYFSNLYDKDKDEAIALAKQNYFELTKELVDFGFTSPIAPVCDIKYEGANDVIGDRSFGNTADKVIALAGAAIEGITEAKGIACIKHIPGHGRSTLDSHHSLPFIENTLEELEKTDFKVFKELSSLHKDLWAMTAHIVYRALDDKFPITLSKLAINYIRNIIGFKGTLVSDAIEMKALHSHISFQTGSINENIDIGERLIYNQAIDTKAQFITSLCIVAKQTLDAGCDLVFHCSGDIEEMTALCEVV